MQKIVKRMEERVKVEKGEGGKQDKKILERVNHGGKYGKAWAATDMRFFPVLVKEPTSANKLPRPRRQPNSPGVFFLTPFSFLFPYTTSWLCFYTLRAFPLCQLGFFFIPKPLY